MIYELKCHSCVVLAKSYVVPSFFNNKATDSERSLVTKVHLGGISTNDNDSSLHMS